MKKELQDLIADFESVLVAVKYDKLLQVKYCQTPSTV